MSENQLWYGFLDAGSKSTAVVLDKRLDTGDPDTIYLFNLARQDILEYRREIVEPKLREFTGEEKKLFTDLKRVFTDVRRNFVSRMSRGSATTSERITKQDLVEENELDLAVANSEKKVVWEDEEQEE